MSFKNVLFPCELSVIHKGHQFLCLLERALRSLASSSGGAACPGATRGQPQGSTPGFRGGFQGDLSEKKNFVMHARTDEGWTDRHDSRNSDVCTLVFLINVLHVYLFLR